MAAIESAIASKLKNTAGVSALVGNRVYRDVAPTNATLPYICFRQIDAEHERHFTAIANMVRVLFIIEIWGISELSVKNVAEQIRLAMDHFYGTLGTTPNTAIVKHTELGAQVNDYVPPSDASQQGVFGVHQTWTFIHTEP